MNLSSQKTGSKVNGLEQSISALGGFTVNYCTFHETLEGVEKLNGSNLNNSGLSLRVQTQLTTLCKMGWGLCYPPGGLPRSIQLLHLDQACVEDLIRNLTNGRACSLEMIKR